MKKFIFTIITSFLLTLSSANADIMPYTSNDIALDTLGMYQVPFNIVIYKTPNEKSEIVYRANWDQASFNCSEGTIDTFFTTYISDKNLGFIQVTDFTDNWAKVIYNKDKHKTGWVKAEDLRFMTWRNFMGTYARRYGIYLFNDIPEENQVLYSGIGENAQRLQSISKNPSKIKLTAIKGNLILITAIENNSGKTGFLKWRNETGRVYAFPAIR
ncbi:MAG: hypothetical protein ACI37S_01145 [Candidatus Gastranaerophilaceae bacterium]